MLRSSHSSCRTLPNCLEKLFCVVLPLEKSRKRQPRFKDRKKRRLGLLHPKQRSVFNFKVFCTALPQAVSPPISFLFMSQHLSSDNGQTPNLLNLLAELAKHPDGLELTKQVYQLHLAQRHSQPMPEEANRNRLIAIALQVVRNEKIENPPYFRGMTNGAIREFITQYSPELVLN